LEDACATLPAQMRKRAAHDLDRSEEIRVQLMHHLLVGQLLGGSGDGMLAPLGN
jgi:hypothetical protein